ncbi:MAG: alpha/beta fold hydrolase [Betaproteobacteria bacterium]|nr:alpha/beta fold hydrolase [Betaproteobacteria bacterium]
MPHARIGNTDIHYDVADYTDPWRRAETVFLHHGFGRNLEFWRAWVPLLARDYRVVRIDARGCGRSAVPPPGNPYTLDMLVADAIDLMDHIGVARVHWAAEASGGHVGLAAAIAHPARIASLTLCNTPFQLPQSANDLFIPEEVEKFGLGHWAHKTLARRIDVDKVDPGWIEWSTGEFDKCPRHIAIAQHAMIAAGNLLPRLREVRAPVLVLAGNNSQIAPREQMLQMREQIPQAKLVLFDGYGQGIAFSAPERCVAEMKTFLMALQ